MPTNIQPNDTIYVPALKVGIQNPATAIKSVKVVSVQMRSVTVLLPEGGTADIGTKLVHKNLSLLIVRIGDYRTETTLLDPLAKSLLQFCRLLLPDDQLNIEAIRTKTELCEIWNRHHKLSSHVVLIGHGSGSSMTFGSEQLTTDDLASCLNHTCTVAKPFISLCCHTGKAEFAKPFSEQAICQSFIAPFRDCHGAAASQFCQTLLARHFLEGMTIKSAFNKSKDAPGGTSFRFWQNGSMR